jgi:hypothetical protein
MSEIKTCCFCAHAAHGPGGCDNCAPKRGCNRPPAYVTGAAATLGRLGGKAGRGEAKRRGDSAYYRALRRTGGYSVSRKLSPGLHMAHVDVPSLAEAKRLARQLYDLGPCQWVQIDGGGRSWTASQRQAAGMRWS